VGATKPPLANGGLCPHYRAEDIDAEKRLFYVGVTRARRLLVYVAERNSFGNAESKNYSLPNRVALRYLGPDCSGSCALRERLNRSTPQLYLGDSQVMAASRIARAVDEGIFRRLDRQRSRKQQDSPHFVPSRTCLWRIANRLWKRVRSFPGREILWAETEAAIGRLRSSMRACRDDMSARSRANARKCRHFLLSGKNKRISETGWWRRQSPRTRLLRQIPCY
jgi:hypothetical protein